MMKDDASGQVVELGQGCLLAKVDIKSVRWNLGIFVGGGAPSPPSWLGGI